MTPTCRLSVRLALLALAMIGLAALSGCGSPKFYPVRGKVILHETGQDLKEGEVRFQPVSRPELVASGKIGKDGRYSLSTPGHGEGALEGACRVAVLVEPKGGKPVIHDRYREFDTSDLRVTVTARDENYFTLEVFRKGR